MKYAPRTKVLIAAVCLAIVTSALVYVFLSRTAAEADRPVTVVIAKRDIPSGTILDAGMLDTAVMRTSTAPAGYVSDPEMAVGQIARTDIKVRTAVLRQQIAPKSRLSQIVPPFMRAVTVALDPIIGVGGFIKPGDRVDVVATFTVNGGTITKTVLQDVELLATGAEVAEEIDPETGKPAKAKVQPNATLAVMPTDAETLILAESKGKLRLTLRRSDDTSYVSSKGVTGRQVIGTVPPDVPEKPARAAAAPAPAPRAAAPLMEREPAPFPLGFAPAGELPYEREAGRTVQVIRGTRIEETVVPE